MARAGTRKSSYKSQGINFYTLSIKFVPFPFPHQNDNCFVEQKNFTHVRELFGYERFDDKELVSQDIISVIERYIHKLMNG